VMLHERIRQTRLKRNKTQDEMAEILGMTRGGYSSYETGKNIPPADRLSTIADTLQVSTDYLLGRSEMPFQIYAILEDEGLSDTEKQLMKKFMAESEEILRDKANITDENVERVLHYMKYTFLEDLRGGKKSSDS
jgi:transcriptional regulator with XRE-family HTH domain